ncbi:unnamed protein product [Lampetra planeri]
MRDAAGHCAGKRDVIAATPMNRGYVVLFTNAETARVIATGLTFKGEMFVQCTTSPPPREKALCQQFMSQYAAAKNKMTRQPQNELLALEAELSSYHGTQRAPGHCRS